MCTRHVMKYMNLPQLAYSKCSYVLASFGSKLLHILIPTQIQSRMIEMFTMQNYNVCSNISIRAQKEERPTGSVMEILFRSECCAPRILAILLQIRKLQRKLLRLTKEFNLGIGLAEVVKNACYTTSKLSPFNAVKKPSPQ